MDKPKSSAEKATRTTVDTISFTVADTKRWKTPPFQRPIKVNGRVRVLAAAIKEDEGVLPGVLTFGIIKGSPDEYIVDGQHRIEAFLLAGVPVGYADVRRCFFDKMAEMGEEFVNLQSHLVAMRPDDVLRGLEPSTPVLQKIRAACPFVGYEMIRRGPESPLLSMSALLRAWAMSERETPSSGVGSVTAVANRLTVDDATNVIDFLTMAHRAWGAEPEYARLWGSLNLVMNMWLYRRLVLTTYSAKTSRMDSDLFLKCLMACSADSHYCDWLVGRNLGERERAPAYGRVKAIYQARIKAETGSTKPYPMPAPPWTQGQKGGSR